MTTDVTKSSSWNYRVIERDGELAIYEVFYDETGRVVGHTETPAWPHAESLSDLAEELTKYAEAVQKPVLPY